MASIEPEQFRALYENGIIGEIEFLDLGDGGLTVACANFALALNVEQIDAARELGIELGVAPGEPLAPTPAEQDVPDDARPRDELRREAARPGQDPRDRAAVHEAADPRAAGPVPSAELAETLIALERVMLVLVEEGGAHFATAVSWLAEPDNALDGFSPAQWVAAGRDYDRLLLIARQDAARLAR